ncbi:ABC1 kinase family protein [Clostridium sp. DL1XJH146]
MKNNSVNRLRKIVKTFAYYGFGYLVNSKFTKNNKSPENLRKAFEELGPTFIKIGQILSTRPDILPEDYIKELSKLQDSAKEESFEDINSVFKEEFNKNINECFDAFDPIPIASASIAQVHRAKLHGNDLIVKIQRPNIEEKMKQDISILYRILNLTKAKFNDSLINPIHALDELRKSTKNELNFIHELDNQVQFKSLNIDISYIYVPNIIYKFSGKKVLSMEYIAGEKIDNVSSLRKKGYNLKDLSKKLVFSYLKQIFEDGFFHCDPHPGNIIVSKEKLCFIDFGLVDSLSPALRKSLNKMIFAFAYKDIDELISVIMSIGIKKGYVNRNKLYEDIDYLMDSYLSTSLSNIKISTLLKEVFDAAKRNNIGVPREFTMLLRGLVIIEGVVAKLSPDLKILDIAIEYIKEKNSTSLLESFDFNDSLLKFISISKDSISLPSKLSELANNLIKGRTKIQLDHNNLNEPIKELNKMVNRLVSALILSSMIIGSSLIINSNIGPKVFDISFIGITGYLIAAIFGFWLLISIIRSGRL